MLRRLFKIQKFGVINVNKIKELTQLEYDCIEEAGSNTLKRLVIMFM